MIPESNLRERVTIKSPDGASLSILAIVDSQWGKIWVYSDSDKLISFGDQIARQNEGFRHIDKLLWNPDNGVYEITLGEAV